MDPPPAPMALMSITGRRIGTVSSRACRVRIGFPSRIRLMSVEVPPISIVTMSRMPASPATWALPTTPPAGPDSTVWTGFSRAESRVIRPPEASITITGLVSGNPRPSSRSASRPAREPR